MTPVSGSDVAASGECMNATGIVVQSSRVDGGMITHASDADGSLSATAQTKGHRLVTMALSLQVVVGPRLNAWMLLAPSDGVMSPPPSNSFSCSSATRQVR